MNDLWLIIVTSNKCGYKDKYGICADTGKNCTKENCPVLPGWTKIEDEEVEDVPR